jgi:hypothetical protein
MSATTYGIGGSATTDGGTGMASALGARFLDAAGEPAGGRDRRASDTCPDEDCWFMWKVNKHACTQR